jgi:hypothetical protein
LARARFDAPGWLTSISASVASRAAVTLTTRSCRRPRSPACARARSRGVLRELAWSRATPTARRRARTSSAGIRRTRPRPWSPSQSRRSTDISDDTRSQYCLSVCHTREMIDSASVRDRTASSPGSSSGIPCPHLADSTPGDTTTPTSANCEGAPRRSALGGGRLRCPGLAPRGPGVCRVLHIRSGTDPRFR